MEEFNSLEEVATNIQNKLDAQTDKKRIIAIYAFNGIGKTRLSNQIGNSESDNTQGDWENEWIKKISYNAFFEDIFTWDNENYILHFNKNHEIIKLVQDQWLETKIIDNFRDIMGGQSIKIEPAFDFDGEEVKFKIASGDDDSTNSIKISRGEESIFVWSVFYTILEEVVSELSTNEADRSIDKFNHLEYIVIDDPVSSIDDTRIITVALKLIEVIKSNQNNQIKFLITTHHALFFNVLVNSINRIVRKKKWKYNFESYILLRNNDKLNLKSQNESPFWYHIILKKIIQDAITSQNIEKYHFNLFRALLEKTSNFLWYNDWDECLENNHNKGRLKHCLQIYSHNRLSELEWRELPDDDKNLLAEAFESFITNFKWEK